MNAERLQAAADAYRRGIEDGIAPVQRVVLELDISRSMATRLVHDARGAGLLRDDERAPKGAAAQRHKPKPPPLVEPGERFLTRSTTGAVRTWETTAGGVPFLVWVAEP